jgi:hypothetical protein
VQNRHTGTGQTVRVMETYQLWVAKLIVKSANEQFAADGRPYKSTVVEI